MRITIKTAALALAASGMTLVAPASAAIPAVDHAVTQPAAYDAQILADQHFDYGKKPKKSKRWKHGRSARYERDYRANRYNRDYRERDYRSRNYDDNRPYYMRYPSNYGEPVHRDTRVWRGDDGRYYCRRDNGTTGLLIGAGVGALIGHEIAGRGGDRTLGAILGGAAGALLGRTIDRRDTRCG